MRPLPILLVALMLALIGPLLTTTGVADADADIVEPLEAQAQSDGCTTGGPPAWFVGIVHDDARRNDFLLDVDNFENFRSRLADVYCMPDSQSEILAMSPGFTRGGKSYTAASESNLMATLADFGAEASATAAEQDPTFFFFLSSHGIMYAFRSCPDGFRSGGSLSALYQSTMYDCELGAALNTHFADHVRMGIAVDCSFCGGFSDSLTAASGTVPDLALPAPSGILGDNRIVMTGCAVTTECFGGPDGGNFYGFMLGAWDYGPEQISRWTAPGFPTIQGIDAPLPLQTSTSTATLSELFFFTTWRAYAAADAIGIQQQYRIKYGPDTLDDDLRIA